MLYYLLNIVISQITLQYHYYTSMLSIFAMQSKIIIVSILINMIRKYRIKRRRVQQELKLLNYLPSSNNNSIIICQRVRFQNIHFLPTNIL